MKKEQGLRLICWDSLFNERDGGYLLFLNWLLEDKMVYKDVRCCITCRWSVYWNWIWNWIEKRTKKNCIWKGLLWWKRIMNIIQLSQYSYLLSESAGNLWYVFLLLWFWLNKNIYTYYLPISSILICAFCRIYWSRISWHFSPFCWYLSNFSSNERFY